MTEIVINEGVEGLSAELAPEPVAAAEPIVELEAVESAAEASVAIAAIEADRDVEVARILAEGDAERSRIAHDADIEALRLELIECRTRAETAEALNIELKEASSTRLPSTPEPEPPSETSHPSGDGGSATPVEPSSEQAPAPEPAKKRARSRWI